MKLAKRELPISPQYDSPIFEALAIQIVLGVVSWLIMDFGQTAQICGIALVAFWVVRRCSFGGILSRPRSQTCG